MQKPIEAASKKEEKYKYRKNKMRKKLRKSHLMREFGQVAAIKVISDFQSQQLNKSALYYARNCTHITAF